MNVILVKMINRKFSWQLRAFRAAAVGFITLFAISCTEPDKPAVCDTGDCSAMFKVPYPKDSNGYYHVDLDFTQQYYPRFYAEVEADPTNPYWWYNDTPVVEAYFSSETVLELEYEDVYVVQPGRIYLHGRDSSKLYGKRLIGPIIPEMIGDTINVNVEILWDAGENYVVKDYLLNFIVK